MMAFTVTVFRSSPTQVLLIRQHLVYDVRVGKYGVELAGLHSRVRDVWCKSTLPGGAGFRTCLVVCLAHTSKPHELSHLRSIARRLP